MDSAIAALIGVIVGTVLGPILEYLLKKRMHDKKWKRESLEKQLNELYRPLYEKCVIMPDEDPEHYFCDWDNDEFNKWLNKTLNIMIRKIDLVPNEVLDKIHNLRGTAGRPYYEAEKDVRSLYKHIDKKFKYLRKKLEIS